MDAILPTRKSFRTGPRVVFWLLALSSAAVVGALGQVSWPRAKAWVYEQRIREGKNPEGNLHQIALLPSSAAVPILEQYVRKPRHGISQKLALRLLRNYQPESTVSRGMQEYGELTGKGDYYIHGFSQWQYEFQDRQRFQDVSIAGLRSWLERYPDHPGRDDANLRIAIALCDTDPLEALKTLHRGFHEPDGDKQRLIANWFQCVLERCATAEQLVAWLDTDCPAGVRANVIYVAAVKRLRQQRFAEMAALFSQWSSLADGELSELPWDLEETRRTPQYRRKKITAQIATSAWIAHESAAAAMATDAESRATILHAVGRRLFHEPEILLNHFYYRYQALGHAAPTVSTWDASGKWNGRATGIEDFHPANHYRQAAEVFERIARECPTYSAIEAVEYSIPLCLWRIYSTRRQLLGPDVNLALSEGFQTFADKYPRSTMADEALYQAGVHHYWAHSRGDTTILERNMARIVKEHSDGDVLTTHATRNAFLQAAIVQRKFADFRLTSPADAGAEALTSIAE